MTARRPTGRLERNRGQRLPRALRPFLNMQYRWLTTALVCSLFSVGIWLVASVWQVIQLGGSASDLSLVAFGSSLGLTLSVLVGGVVADRVPQRRILLVVEVVTPGGNWSSYPPHKHDRDALPEESFLEETYYHRLNPPQGFAFQRVYTDDRSIDETMAVEDGDCVMVPRGYHPVGAPHGYDL